VASLVGEKNTPLTNGIKHKLGQGPEPCARHGHRVTLEIRMPMWRRALSTTRARPETWFFMSCSTKLDRRCSDSSWRALGDALACRENHSAEASCGSDETSEA